MSNPTRGMGLEAHSARDGVRPTPSPVFYSVPSSVTVPVRPNDPVIMTSGGTLTPYVAAGGTGLFGVVASVYDSEKRELPDPNASSHSFAGTGSTQRYVTVFRGTDILYKVREDSDSANIAAADIGNNADLVALSSNAGWDPPFVSGWKLDSDTADTTSTLPVRIEGILEADLENPDAGDSDSNKVILVRVNLEQAAV